LKRYKLETSQSKITGRIAMEVKFRICTLEVSVSNLSQATEAFIVSINLPVLNPLEQIEIVYDCLLLNYL
jgi:hypothetical protein